MVIFLSPLALIHRLQNGPGLTPQSLAFDPSVMKGHVHIPYRSGFSRGTEPKESTYEEREIYFKQLAHVIVKARMS